MTRLTWKTRIRKYENELDRGVFYPKNRPAQVWDGLVSIQEIPSLEERNIYFDGVKIQRRRLVEEFSGTIEAFSYPYSFYEEILYPKINKSFGLTYRTKNKIHIIYNVLIAPTTFVYDQTDGKTLSWDFTTKPVAAPDGKLTSHIIVDTTKAYLSTLEDLENVLYGSDLNEARLPTPTEVFDIFEENSILQIIDNGDGTWTAIGPDNVIQMIDETTFSINWPSAIYISEGSYTIHSL